MIKKQVVIKSTSTEGSPAKSYFQLKEYKGHQIVICNVYLLEDYPGESDYMTVVKSFKGKLLKQRISGFKFDTLKAAVIWLTKQEDNTSTYLREDIK